jgi:hypothetical protein
MSSGVVRHPASPCRAPRSLPTMGLKTRLRSHGSITAPPLASNIDLDLKECIDLADLQLSLRCASSHRSLPICSRCMNTTLASFTLWTLARTVGSVTSHLDCIGPNHRHPSSSGRWQGGRTSSLIASFQVYETVQRRHQWIRPHPLSASRSLLSRHRSTMFERNSIVRTAKLRSFDRSSF